MRSSRARQIQIESRLQLVLTRPDEHQQRSEEDEAEGADRRQGKEGSHGRLLGSGDARLAPAAG